MYLQVPLAGTAVYLQRCVWLLIGRGSKGLCLILAAESAPSFFEARAAFMDSLSPIYAASYLFGVGDRHLGNHLLQATTGRLVVVDFGYSFGAAVTVGGVSDRRTSCGLRCRLR